MSEHPVEAANFASRLMRNGQWSLALIGLSLLTFVLAPSPATPLQWLLPLASFAIAAMMSLYLCFDALLFRLLASFPDEAAGLKAVDDFLERTGLRRPAAALRPAQERIHGTMRILWLQRCALLALFAALVSMA